MVKSHNGLIAWIRSNTRVQVAVIVAISIIGLAALGGGFVWYRMYREQRAMESFIEAIDTSFEPARSQDTQEKWQEVEQAFHAAYEQYKNSSLAGYYRVYVSYALLQQGKHDEACQELEQAIDYIPRDTNLYYSYATRLALMQMDSTDAQLQQTGEDRLKQLTQDTYNPLRNMAMYYRGLRYFNLQDREAAYTIWKELIDTASDDGSAWAERAQAKLAYHE